MIKLGLSKGCKKVFNVCKSVNVIHHIDNLKDKHHMIISLDAEKTFNKIQYPFMKQTKNKQTPEDRHRRNLSW